MPGNVSEPAKLEVLSQRCLGRAILCERGRHLARFHQIDLVEQLRCPPLGNVPHRIGFGAAQKDVDQWVAQQRELTFLDLEQRFGASRFGRARQLLERLINVRDLSRGNAPRNPFHNMHAKPVEQLHAGPGTEAMRREMAVDQTANRRRPRRPTDDTVAPSASRDSGVGALENTDRLTQHAAIYAVALTQVERGA